MFPTLPSDSDNNEEDKPYLITETGDIKLISDYTHLNFNEVVQLDCVTYKILARDAIIDKLSQTEEGREYLENCWVLRQTEPDREKLREKYSRSDK